MPDPFDTGDHHHHSDDAHTPGLYPCIIADIFRVGHPVIADQPVVYSTFHHLHLSENRFGGLSHGIHRRTDRFNRTVYDLSFSDFSISFLAALLSVRNVRPWIDAYMKFKKNLT